MSFVGATYICQYPAYATASIITSDVCLSKAGLFSAVQTAFLIEAYKNLDEDPAQLTVSLLRQIDRHIQELRASQADTNPTISTMPGDFIPSQSAIRVNCVWFASLILSLGISVVIVLVKQWLNRYDYASASGSDRDRARLRQYRYTGLQQWKVPQIIGALPILLLAALSLFFWGLVEFLWGVNTIVAVV
ncbi:hypothetical protein BOTBODRAFT_118964, partial [Botryobasidium botryosum FD-172 SS1]